MEKDKRQILSEMIHLAQVDQELDAREYDFIVVVAQRLGVDKTALDKLIEKPDEIGVYKTELERITQFHRLVLLMNVDKQTHVTEINAIRNHGMRMGMRPEAIEQVLQEMNDHENKMIPAKRLIEIFKKYYN